jgi:hypothetical protein
MAGKRPRTRASNEAYRVNVFSANTALGWKVIRQVPVEFALEQIALCKWREIWYENGELAGVQSLKPVEKKTLHQVLTERLVAVTITLSEVRRNAGLYGRSHTIGMSEWKRLRRHARFDERKILPPEDATERAIEKVRQWPYPASVKRDQHGDAVTDEKGQAVFGDRAVRVYPPAPKKSVRRKRV